MGIYDRDYYQADELRPLRPWDRKTMVTLLIIANAAVYLANFLFTGRNGAIAMALSLEPQDLQQPLQWFHIVSYGFVHDPGTPFHLIFNMLGLYFLGRNVEDKYGKWEFFRIYMISIVLCGLGWCLLRYFSGDPGRLLGASGAVTTIAMLFVLSFPKATLMLYGVVPVKAWLLGIIIVLMNVFGSSKEVAYDVHLIGAGLAAVYFFGGLNFGFFGSWYDQGSTLLRSKQRGLKVHRPANPGYEQAEDEPPSRDEVQADRLLDKIHRDGKDSLTAKEQAFLENYSRKVREKRR